MNVRGLPGSGSCQKALPTPKEVLLSQLDGEVSDGFELPNKVKSDPQRSTTEKNKKQTIDNGLLIKTNHGWSKISIHTQTLHVLYNIISIYIYVYIYIYLH